MSVGVWQIACRRLIVVGEKAVKTLAGVSLYLPFFFIDPSIKTLSSQNSLCWQSSSTFASWFQKRYQHFFAGSHTQQHTKEKRIGRCDTLIEVLFIILLVGGRSGAGCSLIIEFWMEFYTRPINGRRLVTSRRMREGMRTSRFFNCSSSTPLRGNGHPVTIGRWPSEMLVCNRVERQKQGLHPLSCCSLSP